MPHHRQFLVSPAPPAAGDTSRLTCKGVRGNLVALEGSTWTLAYPLPDITWSAPAGIQDGAYLQPIIQQLLLTDVSSNLLGAEVYKVSQALADMVGGWERGCVGGVRGGMRGSRSPGAA